MSTKSLAELSLPTYGRLGSLSDDQKEKLAQFKTDLQKDNVWNLSYDDHLLLRFLRARKFDLLLTRTMFENYHKWRIEANVDDLRDNLQFPEYLTVKEYYPRYYHKVDKLGRPIYIEQLGTLDPKKLFTATTIERMMENHVYEYEKLVNYRLKACSLKTGTYLEQSCTILDLKGVYLSSFSSIYGTVKQISAVAQDYYPEMLGKMYIINAPMLFTAVWGMVKILLDEVTVSKINILGSSYKSKLLETIDEINLPAAFGGKCNCVGGCDKSDLGPWNDFSVEGYPKKEFERFNIEFGVGQGPKVPK